jgi:hypothetical protein
MFGAYQIQHITEYHSPYFQAECWLDHIICMLVIVKDWGVFQDKNKQNGAKYRQNMVQSAFHQTLEDKIHLSAGQ